jgi:N-acetylglucosaminyldiphosphoundecaprenol N-acetyl-beta-D-mannosaminyltransferase
VSNRVVIQSIPVDGLDLVELLARTRQYIENKKCSTIAYVNIHVLNTAVSDSKLTKFLANVDTCYADGKGVVLGAKILGKELPPRMTGADWIEDIAQLASERGWRLGWVGSGPGVIDDAVSVLTQRHPDLQVPLTADGYFQKEGSESDALIEKINSARVDLLLVGMGTPIQEHWVAENRDKIDAPLVWCLGATADFIAGKNDRGPTWLHQNHEWIARLITEPKRLWKRYLIGNPRFLLRMIFTRIFG